MAVYHHNEIDTDIGFIVGITIIFLFTFFLVAYGLPYIARSFNLPHVNATTFEATTFSK